MLKQTQGTAPEHDEDSIKLEKLMADLIAKGMLKPADAPAGHESMARPDVPAEGGLPPPASPPSAPATRSNKGRKPPREAVLKDLKDAVLGQSGSRAERAASAGAAKAKEVEEHMKLFNTPEGVAKLAAMSPKDRERAQKRARMAAQDAHALEMARQRNERVSGIRKEKYEGIAKNVETKQSSHDLAKSQRDIVIDNLLRKGYDKEFAIKHSKTLDANCPTCEYNGIKSPLSRNFDGIEYSCANPDCGGTFTPLDPTAKKVSWKTTRKPQDESKSAVFKGKWKSSEELKPRILRKD